MNNTLLDNENVLLAVRRYLAAKNLGTISTEELCRHVNNIILPTLGLTGPNDRICTHTAWNWPKKLGYICKDVKKGIYVDGHEQPNVIAYHEKFLKEIASYERFMCTYDDQTMESIPPHLCHGERKHVLVAQDECIFHVNECPRRQWLKKDQQPLKKKGNGRSIHVCGWICKTIGQLRLSEEQIKAQASLPEADRLRATDAHKTIYPGKNHNTWWDLNQLMSNLADTVDIFEFTHPGKVGVFLFNCSSAHEGLAQDALNVNNMNIGPGGKQCALQSTMIPLSNPPPQPGRPDTRGQPQHLVFSPDHPDENLRNQPKGMHVVLEERVSVWDELVKRSKKEKPVGKCKDCAKSQVKKDAERRVAEAEAMGHEDVIEEADIRLQDEPEEPGFVPLLMVDFQRLIHNVLLLIHTLCCDCVIQEGS
ncbi:hypothetical protein HWV62_16698 [Athelia sp. TMB]|nr:hypothetical protein HWV62_16698 [Athelia sp. TMB]